MRRLHLFVKIVKPAGWLIIVARCLPRERGRERVKGITEEFGTIMKLAGREGGVCPTTPQHTAGRQADMQLAQISLSPVHCSSPSDSPLLIRSSELLVLKINV